MEGLDLTTINDLLANSRNRNTYGPKLAEFAESDEPAIDPSDVWSVEFGGKEATSMYQGFLNAAKKAELHVSQGGPINVLKREDKVFIMHMERVAALKDAEVTES